MTYRDFLKDLEGQKLYHSYLQGIHTLTTVKHYGHMECTLLRVEEDFIVLGFKLDSMLSKAAWTSYAPITSVHCAPFLEEKK